MESLTAARAGAAAGTEPSDALRVVNALLTQLDKLRYRPNVLVLSTSNLAKAIDSAFVDRADIVRYIDLPPAKAVYEILRSCLLEFVTKGVVNHIVGITLPVTRSITSNIGLVIGHTAARAAESMGCRRGSHSLQRRNGG